MELKVTSRQAGPRTVVDVAGEIDVYTAPSLRTRLDEVVDEGHHDIVVDLDGVGFMDSTGLGVLVGAHQILTAAGGGLRVVCRQERILKVFRITGMDRVFPIFASLDDALAAHDIDLRDDPDEG